MTKRLWKWTVAAGLVAGAGTVWAANSAELAKRLHHAAEISSIDDPALKPWHLKLDVQLYNDKGQPSEKGTVEEWWTPGAYKRVYALPSYSATEIYSNKTLYRTAGQPDAPYLLDEGLRSVVHPMIPDEIIDRLHLALEIQSFGDLKLDCIVLSKSTPPIRLATGEPALGEEFTSCLGSGADEVRVSWLEPEISLRKKLGTFQGRQVGIDSSISLYRTIRLSQHIAELEGESFDASLFKPNSDLEEKLDEPVWVSPVVTRSTLHHKSPVMPPFTANSGTVMLLATIGTDGHVTSVDVIASPHPDLAKSAVAAVKQWVYVPHLINGVAVTMKTTIKVRFNLGPL